MQQGLQGQTRAQRQGDFKDNSTIETNFGELCCFVLHLYYLSIKESSFFWFVVMRSTEPGFLIYIEIIFNYMH
jgi:hypothetical protein